jgi:hypothetical protein
MRPRHARAALYAAIVIVAIAASVTSLANGFALDDVAIVADNARVHSLHRWWELFGAPYWPPQFGASLYRPILTLGFAAQWVAGGGAPWVFHAVSVVLYTALCALVLALFFDLVPPVGAAIGAVLFAVHPVHVEAVANVVGQSELLAATAMIGACVIYVRARRTGHIGAVPTAVIALLFVIACLSKEHGLLLPLLLAALELLAVHGEEPSGSLPLRARVRAAGALFGLLGVLGMTYLGVRTAVLGDVLGEMHPVPVYGIRRLWVMLVVVPHWLRLLAWPAHLSADYSPQQIPVLDGPGPELMAGLLSLAAAALTFLALGNRAGNWRGERSAARLGLAWMAVTLLPVSNLFSVMIVEERTLLMSSVGAMLLAGAGAAVVWRERPEGRNTLAWRVCLTAMTGCLVLAGLLRSRARQPVWRDDTTLFTQTVEDAPRSYRAQFFYGQLLFAQGRLAEGERHLRLAIALNPTPADVSPLNFLATEYRDAGMCPRALPLYERALANDAARPDVRYGLASCLLATGRVAEARRLAEDGLRRGDLKAFFLELIARADSARVRGG